jgi:hypothetical protein
VVGFAENMLVFVHLLVGLVHELEDERERKYELLICLIGDGQRLQEMHGSCRRNYDGAQNRFVGAPMQKG